MALERPRWFVVPHVLFLVLCSITIPDHLSAVTISHLPGFLQGPLPFSLETGYITVDEVYGVEFFYYFIESERNPTVDPLVVWLSGGPGCSALSGLALEIGPVKFKLEEYNGSLPNMVYNPYTWTKFANIIFLDSPVGAGFSYSHHPKGYETSDKSWSKQTQVFLKKWLFEHQKFISNPLYIAGDSYAGKVVPVIAQLISKENEFGMHPTFKLQGYMIGNPYTGDKIDVNARIPYALSMGIISDEFFEMTTKLCKGQTYEFPDTALCDSQIQIFEGITSEISENHILEPKCTFASPKLGNKVGERFMLMIHENNTILWRRPTVPDVKCRRYAYHLLDIWANTTETWEALHVKKGTVQEWKTCNKSLAYTKNIKSSIEYQINLTTQGYRALVYSGDHDLVFTFIGTKEWIRSLGFAAVDEWRSWHVHGQVAGYTISYSNNLTFATIKGGGHTAPEYKPRECMNMAWRWMNNKSL
ncbi:hypothetical protein HPP92_015751 [Vanilla planifolia]|uniref:Uncharacterized protein n=1 Tax=Vanilla planifolia TaxID=51239 RepID=A0A835QQ27_VANPL|nr:hypothetical protein HPP92_015751 [Vanilla planifolia]